VRGNFAIDQKGKYPLEVGSTNCRFFNPLAEITAMTRKIGVPNHMTGCVKVCQGFSHTAGHHLYNLYSGNACFNLF
jgi:hypothetical protein